MLIIKFKFDPKLLDLNLGQPSTVPGRGAQTLIFNSIITLYRIGTKRQYNNLIRTNLSSARN
jgi:hypothetical protein